MQLHQVDLYSFYQNIKHENIMFCYSVANFSKDDLGYWLYIENGFRDQGN